MKESEFWSKLEYRVCQELDDIEAYRKQGYWCDGFIPQSYELSSSNPQINGLVWIGTKPRHQEAWRFTLHLNTRYESKEEIQWLNHLPSSSETNWLEASFAEEILELRRDLNEGKKV